MATVSVLLRVVLFSLRVVLLWGAAHYDPPFFNDCRGGIARGITTRSRESITRSEEGTTRSECHGHVEFAVYVTRMAVGVDGQTSAAIWDAIIGLP